MQMKSFLYQTKLVSIAKSYSEFSKCFGLIFWPFSYNFEGLYDTDRGLTFMAKFVVKCGVLCLLFLVVKSVKQPLSVTRDVLDSFRVDEFSCEADRHVCTRRNALCQPDGSCMCRNNTPDYVNPKLDVKYGYLGHGMVDGCMSVAPLVDSIDPCMYEFIIIFDKLSWFASKLYMG